MGLLSASPVSDGGERAEPLSHGRTVCFSNLLFSFLVKVWSVYGVLCKTLSVLATKPTYHQDLPLESSSVGDEHCRITSATKL